LVGIFLAELVGDIPWACSSPCSLPPFRFVTGGPPARPAILLAPYLRLTAPAPPMSEVTRILSAIEQGDPHAADQLLPLVYDELRKLAAQRLAHEKPGQTLQATALVHEAYLRLVASPGRESGEAEPYWNSRGHFFAAAAEAMRRILVDSARSRSTEKRGGG